MSIEVKERKDIVDFPQQEKIWKRRVFEALERLLDSVSKQELIKQLPYLDCSTWDELIEERYIGKLCGNPLCNATVISKSTQRYHIDKKNKKVYEVCTERNKFCDEKCFLFSCSIRCQLFSEPLWQTGETTQRMNKEFILDELVIVPEKRRETIDSIELIGDKVVSAMNDLKVVERDDSTDEDIEDEEKHDLLWKYEDDDCSTAIFKEFHPTESPIHLSYTDKAIESGRLMPSKKQSNDSEINKVGKKLTANQQSDKLHLNRDEISRIKRLRDKYSKATHMKGPTIIEVPEIYREGVRKCKVNKLQGSVDALVLSQNRLDTQIVDALFSGWLTERSRDLVKLGRRQLMGEMNLILKKFFMGDAFSEDDEDNILLPNIDLIDIEKRRLHILLQTIKPTWLKMEYSLGVRSSHVEDFVRLAASFNLQPDTIVGFSKAQCKLISIVAWRIICHLDSVLEEQFFPGGYFSDKISDYLRDNEILESDYIQLVNVVLKRI